MDLNKKNMKNIMLLIVFAVLLYVCVQKINSVAEGFMFVVGILIPFVAGGIMAFILNVPMSAIERRLFGALKQHKRARRAARPVSLVLAILLVVGIILVVMLVLIPEMGRTFASISVNIERALHDLQKWGIQTFQDNKQMEEWIQTLEFNWDSIIQTAIDFLKNGAGSVLTSTFSVARTVINYLVNFFIGFVLYAFLPENAVQKTLDVASLSYRTFSNFVTGQCLEAVILGTMFFVVMSIFQFPYALLIGVVIAFTALIPIFGAFIGCVIGAFLILVVNPMKALMFIILFLVLQQIEGNLIYPHVVGGSVGLPSIWVLLAVTVGGSLMGVLGMLIFIPLFSVLYALFREFVYKRLKERGIHDI